MCKKLVPACAGVALASMLAACGGSGGGSAAVNSAGTVSPLSAPPPVSNMPPAVVKPSSEAFDTDEYRRSSGAVGSNAIAAWQMGASGKGVTIGIVDTGIVSTLSEFAGRISPASSNVSGSGDITDTVGHGTAVASIAGASRDGSGMMGVAYEASLFVSKASSGFGSNVSYGAKDVADGIIASVNAGAKVINLSIGGDSGGSIESAVRQAAAAGCVIVIAAGNSGSQPSEFAIKLAKAAPGHVIIVGALGASKADGTIDYSVPSIYTSSAGAAKDIFLAAPGWLNAVTGLKGDTDFFSGTSFAAPVVSGAAALLLQAFPNLTPQQVVAILLYSADDIGAAGVDLAFGHGRINIGKAFQPVGTVTLASSDKTPVSSIMGSLPPASGDAAEKAMIKAIGLDAYRRAYSYNLASGLARTALPGPLSRMSNAALKHNETNVGPLSIGITTSALTPLPLDNSQSSLDIARSTKRPVSLRATGRVAEGLSFALASREPLVDGVQLSIERFVPSAHMMITSSHDSAFSRDPRKSAALTASGRSWAFSAGLETGKVGSSERLKAAYRTQFMNFLMRGSNLGLVISRREAIEDESFLGAQLPSFFGASGAKSTLWSASLLFGGRARWNGSISYLSGRTTFGAGQMRTDGFDLQVSRNRVFTGNDVATFKLSQPLRANSGVLSVIAPVSWDYQTGQATSIAQEISLRPSGRELTAEIGYSTRGAGSWFSANLYGRRQPGHLRDAPPDVGVAARAGLKF